MPFSVLKYIYSKTAGSSADEVCLVLGNHDAEHLTNLGIYLKKTEDLDTYLVNPREVLNAFCTRNLL